MYRRQPSTASPSSSTSGDSAVRRCSGQARPFLSDVAKEDNSFEVDGESTCSYEEDDNSLPVDRHPTILLVKSGRSSQRYVSGPQLPSLASRSPAQTVTRVVVTTSSVLSLPLDAVPSDVEPASPQGSTISRSDNHILPPGLLCLSLGASPSSPSCESTSPSTQASVSPRARCISPLGLEIPPQSSASSPVESSCSSRTFNDSQCSLISPATVTSTVPPSFDDNRTPLIPFLDTTQRFTHRWPMPKILRTLPVVEETNAVGLPKSPSQTDIALLDAEQGFAVYISARWTSHKWCLLASVTTVFAWGLVCLTCAVMTWIQGWSQAVVMLTADTDVLVFITLTGSIYIFASLIGMAGLVLDSRRLLAAYTILLWPGFMSLVTIGYLAYKRSTFALDDKLDLAWSEGYTSQDRLIIQNSLRCCGYFDALHEAIFSTHCFPRTLLPSCKGELYRFEKSNLGSIWAAAFTMVPLQIANMLIALLCANHVTRAFGEGITPAYCRLTTEDVEKVAEDLLRSSGIGEDSKKKLEEV